VFLWENGSRWQEPVVVGLGPRGVEGDPQLSVFVLVDPAGPRISKAVMTILPDLHVEALPQKLASLQRNYVLLSIKHRSLLLRSQL
jgi:hypothetical protein